MTDGLSPFLVATSRILRGMGLGTDSEHLTMKKE